MTRPATYRLGELQEAVLGVVARRLERLLELDPSAASELLDTSAPLNAAARAAGAFEVSIDASGAPALSVLGLLNGLLGDSEVWPKLGVTVSPIGVLVGFGLAYPDRFEPVNRPAEQSEE